MRNKRNIIVILAVFVLCLAVLGCGKKEEKKEDGLSGPYTGSPEAALPPPLLGSRLEGAS